jgi:hypothetical protein
MRPSPVPVLAVVLCVAAALACASPPACAGPARGAYRPRVAPAEFSVTVDNPWLPLVPGATRRYVEREGAQTRENVVTVLRKTRKVMGVTCTVVHDIVIEDGRTVEETYDWFAQDRRGNVWYFGESTIALGTGGQESPEGSWEAGVNGAQPGIVMPARPRPGAPYRQEYLAGHAEDMGQVVAVGDSAQVPYGRFTGCVRTREWSPLEQGSELKWYARGVGCVRTESTSGEVSELAGVGRR